VCPVIGSFWGFLKAKAERSYRVRDCNSHFSPKTVRPSKSIASLRPQITTSQEEFLLFFRNFMLVFTAAMRLHRIGNDASWQAGDTRVRAMRCAVYKRAQSRSHRPHVSQWRSPQLSALERIGRRRKPAPALCPQPRHPSAHVLSSPFIPRGPAKPPRTDKKQTGSTIAPILQQNCHPACPRPPRLAVGRAVGPERTRISCYVALTNGHVCGPGALGPHEVR
jgi:hypothetical protein